MRYRFQICTFFALVLFLFQARAEEPQSFSEKSFHFLKGEPAGNALYLGMWSHHFSNELGLEENNQLLAIQYKGFFAGTFINSYSDRVYTAGISRQLYTGPFFHEDLQYEVGYRVNLIYGYKKEEIHDPHIGRWNLLPLLSLGLNYKVVGVELSILPINLIAVSLKFNLPS